MILPRGSGAAALVAASALMLSACAFWEREEAPHRAAAPAGALPPPTDLASADAAADPLELPGAVDDAPAIFLDLEADPGRPVSIVFAIDAADNGPADDQAIRLTPDGGLCNPQELARYGDRGETAPAFGPDDAARGVDPRRLPEFMAVAVSRRMIEAGLAADPEATRPQNVCTRKLWERLVVGQSQAAASAGQLE